MGKQIRLSEDALKNIIMENVKKTLKESALDIVGSGLADYQGTGSPESKERMKKIRDKSDKLYGGMSANIQAPGGVPDNKSTWGHAKDSFGGSLKDRIDSFDEFVKPLKDKLHNLPKGSQQRERLYDLYRRFYIVHREWSKENKGASNGPAEKKLDEAIDRAVRKTLKEMRGLPGYDEWKTREPDYFNKPDMIDKDDFMEWAGGLDDGDAKNFMEWLRDYDEDIYGQVSLKAGDAGSPVMAAMDCGLDWKEIAKEFLEQRPVNYYPGD